jgi:hypothetical protein
MLFLLVIFASCDCVMPGDMMWYLSSALMRQVLAMSLEVSLQRPNFAAALANACGRGAEGGGDAAVMGGGDGGDRLAASLYGRANTVQSLISYAAAAHCCCCLC